MHIVLEAIQHYWEEEDKNGHDISLDQKQDLQRLAEGCAEVLLDLETLLGKHASLGSGSSLLARMRWAPKDIGPIRNRLILRTTLLATFNNTITYDQKITKKEATKPVQCHFEREPTT